MPEIPFAHQWVISENRLLSLKDSDYGRLCSVCVSNIPEFVYYMEIFPNGNKDQHRGETLIFLQLKLKSVEKVQADFKFTFECAKSQKNHCIYETSKGRGIRVCSTDEFFDPENRFIVDGKVTVKVDGIFKFETENSIPFAIEQKWTGGELGNEFWKTDSTKDLTIICRDGKEIMVHKFILRFRSDVFTAMLNSNMTESIDSRVTIPYFSSKVVETALKIVYDCNFTSSLTMYELMHLVQFFDKYLLQTLKVKVETFLIAKISAATVCRLTNCSLATNSFKLKEKCVEFLLAAFQSKIPLADIDDLDEHILLQIVINSFYGALESSA